MLAVLMMFLTNCPELLFVMRCLGMRLTPQHVHKLLLEFDDNGSGGVELGEFQRLVDNLVSENIKVRRKSKYLL